MSATLTAGGNAITLQVANPVRDDLVGMIVWCSTTSGFTPGPATQVYNGADLTVQIIGLTAGTAHYVRYALLSEIDPTDYDVSAQYTATPVAAAEAGANKTYVDGTGKIQGVSSGAGTAVSNTNIALAADGTLTGAGASAQVSLTSIPGTLQATHLGAFTMAASSSITAGTASDGVVIEGAGKRISIRSAGVERIRLGYGVGVGAAYGLQVKSSTGKVLQDTADGVMMRGDVTQDNYSIGDSSTGGVDATFGTRNVAVGTRALATAGSSKQENIAIGTDAMRYATSASSNIAVGQYALKKVTTGGANCAIGRYAGMAITTCNFNLAIGDVALSGGGVFDGLAPVGDSNVAIGHLAMQYSAGAACATNTAVGAGAGANLAGYGNTVLGVGAGANVFGNENTVLGNSAGGANSGDRNVLIGYGAGSALPATARAVVLVGGSDGADAPNGSIILSDGDGNVRAKWDGAAWTLAGSVAAEGSFIGGAVSRSTNLDTITGTRFFGHGAGAIGAPVGAETSDGVGLQMTDSAQITQLLSYGAASESFLLVRVNDAPGTGSFSEWRRVVTTPVGGNLVLSSMVLSAGAGIGYDTGAGGAVTQATSKATGVTLNKACGKVTLNAAALAANAAVSFTLTNSTIAATDVVQVSIASGATAGAYLVQVDAVAAGSCRVSLRNMTAVSLSEALVLNFAVIKAASA